MDGCKLQFRVGEVAAIVGADGYWQNKDQRQSILIAVPYAFEVRRAGHLSEREAPFSSDLCARSTNRNATVDGLFASRLRTH